MSSPVSPHTEPVDGWERWSVNGEFKAEHSLRAGPAGEQLERFLTWVVREYASRARRVHQGCGTIPFAFGPRRTPPTIDWAFLLWFDLALMDRDLIEDRLRQRGAALPHGEWPGCWLEREGLTLFVDAHECCVDATGEGAPNDLIDRWRDSVGVGVSAGTAVGSLVDKGVGAFAGTVLVAAHELPAPAPRPTRDDSLGRHRSLVAALAPEADVKGLGITWTALWRLPSGLKVSHRGEPAWLRFPAVSFVAALHEVDCGRSTRETPLR